MITSSSLKNDTIEHMVWQAKIPLTLEIAMSDWSSGEIPLRLYYNYPRMGYLGNILTDIKEYINKCGVDVKYEDLWLEHNKTPVRWDLPFGVVYDCIKPQMEKDIVHLYVRMKSFPENDIVRFPKNDSVIDHWLNTLKEANLVKHPKDNVILGLGLNETDQIKKIIRDNGLNLRKDFNRIMTCIDRNGIEDYGKFPVKLLFDNGQICLTKSIEIKPECHQTFTLKDYYITIFGKEKFDKVSSQCEFIIQGIDTNTEKALELPFVYYYLNFYYMDNFLYIIIRNKSIK